MWVFSSMAQILRGLLACSHRDLLQHVQQLHQPSIQHISLLHSATRLSQLNSSCTPPSCNLDLLQQHASREWAQRTQQHTCNQHPCASWPRQGQWQAAAGYASTTPTCLQPASTLATVMHEASSTHSSSPTSLIAPTSQHKSNLVPIPLQNVVTSHHPPVVQGVPGSAVQYPFPVQYYEDREAIVYSLQQAQPQSLIALPGKVFNVPVRVDILHRVVRWIRAMWRQGTHKAKRRGEVSGGGRKPWTQKGTGRARHGSIRSPIFVGGGAAHGPIPRSHAHKLPLSIQLMGYKCALSAKANEGRLVLVDSLCPTPVEVNGKLMVKTKHTQKQLRALLMNVPYETALLVDCGEDSLDGGEALRRGARNLPWACIMPWQQVTVYHLLKYQALVITKPAALAMAARLQLPPITNAKAHSRRMWAQQQHAAYQAAVELLSHAESQTPAFTRS